MGAAAVAATWPAVAAIREPLSAERTLSFYNIHTGESLKAAYWVQGDLNTSVLGDINYLLRDHRSGEVRISIRACSICFMP